MKGSLVFWVLRTPILMFARYRLTLILNFLCVSHYLTFLILDTVEQRELTCEVVLLLVVEYWVESGRS
jgi:hypothetical protein